MRGRHIELVCVRLPRLQIQFRILRSFLPRNRANLGSKIRFSIRQKEHTLKEKNTIWNVKGANYQVNSFAFIVIDGVRLGVQVRFLFFDSKLTMAIHISKRCNSAFYYLYNLRRVGKCLSKDNTKTLVHAFISCRIDFYMACRSINSLSYSVCRTCVLVRLICNESKYCHITSLSLSVDLHWHTVKFRIEFKILLIVFQILKVLAYLSFLINPKPVSTGCFKVRSDFFFP